LNYIEDPFLSMKSKGVLDCIILLRKKGEIISVSNIGNMGTDKKTSVRTSIKELIDNEYIYKERAKTEDGRYSGWNYYLTSKCYPKKKK